MSPTKPFHRRRSTVPSRRRWAFPRTGPWALLAVLLGLGSSTVISAQPAVPSSRAEAPFSIVGHKVYTVADDDPAVVRRQPIEIRWSALDRWADRPEKASSQLLRLPLFDDTLELPIQSVERTLEGWALVADGGRAVLVWGAGHLFGSVHDRGTAYRVRSTPDGPVLEAVDVGAYPGCRDAPPAPAASASTPDPESTVAASSDTTLGAAKDSGADLDLLVVYTGVARTIAGGDAAIRRLIELGVTETNVAFLMSGVETRLRLLEMRELEDYSESGVDIGGHLDRLTDPDDGFMDGVHPLRDELGADLVVMVGTSTFGGCGVAWLMEGSQNAGFESLAFSYTASRCISPNYTFGHEIGHNLGSRHAPGDPTAGEGAFAYSMGYKDPDGAFRSMMALGCDSGPCPRLLRWSSPLGSHGDLPVGNDDQDNARSIQAVRELVANFREVRQRPGGRLGWTTSSIEVDEHAGTVELVAFREGLTAGEVQVTWAVHSQSAEAGIDVAEASGIFTWAAGESGEQTALLPIFEDGLIEGDESFLVELRGPSDSAGLGDISVLTVHLRDNDVEPFECWDASDRLCLGRDDHEPGAGLGDGRFEVRVEWRGADGAGGVGRAVPSAGDRADSGLMWLFSPDNWEFLVKVLDGCETNGHHWVLFAAGTDVEYELRITDTLRGERRIYRNAPGTPAKAVSDVEAFAGCP